MARSKVVESKRARRQAKKRRAALMPWAIGAGIAVLIAIPVVVNVARSSNLPGERFRDQGNTHIQLGTAHPDYNSNPPTSGWHTPDHAGFSSFDYIVPDERLVHSMEDGGVIMWYRFGTPEENAEHIKKLEEVASGYRRVTIVPRENLGSEYALTAWTRLQRFDGIDEKGMRAFLEAYEGLDHHVAGTG